MVVGMAVVVMLVGSVALLGSMVFSMIRMGVVPVLFCPSPGEILSYDRHRAYQLS